MVIIADVMLKYFFYAYLPFVGNFVEQDNKTVVG